MFMELSEKGGCRIKCPRVTPVVLKAGGHDKPIVGVLSSCREPCRRRSPRGPASRALDARSTHCDCARVRWAAHATWHSAARVGAPAQGEPLTHGSNTRRQTRAALRGVQACCRRSSLDSARACLVLLACFGKWDAATSASCADRHEGAFFKPRPLILQTDHTADRKYASAKVEL